MKKINKSIKLIALLVVCMAMPTLAGAQVLKNAYFNVDWQINSPFGQDFSKKTSGWGAHAEGGYYVIPNFRNHFRSTAFYLPVAFWCGFPL